MHSNCLVLVLQACIILCTWPQQHACWSVSGACIPPCSLVFRSHFAYAAVGTSAQTTYLLASASMFHGSFVQWLFQVWHQQACLMVHVCSGCFKLWLMRSSWHIRISWLMPLMAHSRLMAPAVHGTSVARGSRRSWHSTLSADLQMRCVMLPSKVHNL